jgi:plastocyanin
VLVSPKHRQEEERKKERRKNFKIIMISRMPSSLLAGVLLSAFLLLVSTSTTTLVNGIAFESPNWIIPSNFQPYPSMAVNVGDTLTFNWSGGVHDVWIYPSGTCDDSGAYLIGSSSGTTYSFTEEDAGETLTFVCAIGTHCEAGMLMDTFVVGDGSDTDAPTEPDEFPADEFESEEEDESEEEELEEEEEDEEELEEEIESFAPCYVCGNEIDQITNPTTIVQLPGGQQNPEGFFPVACQDLFNDGLTGEIPESSCPIITNLAIMPCGCLNPDEPTPVCNICGNDPVDISIDGSGNFYNLTVQLPNNTVSLPTEEEPNFICSELAASGLNSELTPTQCQAATLFAFTPCGCGINPADITFDTCDICSNAGNSSVPLNPDTVLRLNEQDSTSTCGELHDLGLANGLGQARCRAATFRATRNCNCSISEVATSEPTVEPSTADDEDDEDEVYVCNVCGDSTTDGVVNTMSNPEVNFTDPNGLLINCGMLNDAGILGGIITPNDCALISPFASTPCGCSTGITDEDTTTDAPTDTVADGTTTIAPVAVAEDTTDAPVVDVTTTDAPVPIPNTPLPVPALTTPPAPGSGTAVGVEGTESTSSSSSSSTNSLAFLIGTALVVVTTLFL